MIAFNQRITSENAPATRTVTLDYERRQHSRFTVALDDGEPALIDLPRGTRLMDGDILVDAQGLSVRVRAATEDLSVAAAHSPLQFARACYHFGNRHVPLQIGELWFSYARDHVLDELAVRLGLQLTHERAPFQPESGAYHLSHAHV